MGIIKFLKGYALRRKIRREQQLRERCLKYADNNCLKASVIYRFIVKGTYIDSTPDRKKMVECIYPNLEGIIHQAENPEK